MTNVWSPIKIGSFELPHRLVMAPMTRSRAMPDGTPGDLAPLYYAQRATTGLLITEGTQPSDDGQGYLATPGIYADAHVAGWRKVTDAVHAAGGRRRRCRSATGEGARHRRAHVWNASAPAQHKHPHALTA